MKTYPIAIHKEKNSCYGVTVPDMPGCFSAGDTLEEALEQAKEAIVFHAEGLAEDGLPIPKIHPIEKHFKNPDYKDAIWAAVSVDLDAFEGKSVRLNITLPEKIVKSGDAWAKRHSMTRSRFLATAAKEYMLAHA